MKCVHVTRLRHLLVRLLTPFCVAGWFCSAVVAQPAPTSSLGAAALKSPALARKIVLIGGEPAASPTDYLNAIPLLAAWLKAAPAFSAADVLTYTGGWPSDASVLEGASTVVLYSDGLAGKSAPFADPARLAQLHKLADAGTGLIALHLASSAPAGGTSQALDRWFGVITDRSPRKDAPERVTLRPATPAHPVTAGLAAFTYEDAFAFVARFSPEAPSVIPVLSTGTGPAAQPSTIPAWAFERADGGRSFTFTGGHDLLALQQPAIRQLLVNAIAWTARLDVPAGGISVPEPIVGKAVVNRRDENRAVDMPWGQLRWFTSAELKNSRTMTTGVAIIKPGQANPRHFHPNCDEILHVVSGRIRHTMNEVTVEMTAGDTVSIPQGVLHNALNIGEEDAVLAISFSTAYREAVGYDTK